MAVEWEGEFDPAEVLEYRMDFYDESKEPEDRVLEDGEEIVSFTVAVTPEAALLGLTIREDGDYAPTLDVTATKIVLWFEVDADEQDNAAFTAGAQLGVEGTVVTSSTPARTRQRTFLLTVKQL